MIKTALVSMALTAFVGSSSFEMQQAVSSNAMPDERPTLRLFLGMPTEDFARQAIAVQPRPIVDPIQIVATPMPEALNPTRPGLSIIREPHNLILEVNGHTFRFRGGGGTAATWVANMPRITRLTHERSGSLYDRIGSIRFDLEAELVSLADAIAAAEGLCRDMQQAGLGSARPDWPLAGVTNWKGPYRRVQLNSFADVQRIFLDPVARAETVGACMLAHGDTSFSLEIRNYRRAREYSRTPEQIATNERSRETELAYRVSGEIGWNDGPAEK